MGVSVEIVDQKTKKKGHSDCIPQDFLQDRILEHSDEDRATDKFALAVYGMVTLLRVLKYVEVMVVDLL